MARPAKVKETLLKYIPADELPVQYGGFKTDDDTEFSNETVSEVVVKPGSSETIEIPAPEVNNLETKPYLFSQVVNTIFLIMVFFCGCFHRLKVHWYGT